MLGLNPCRRPVMDGSPALTSPAQQQPVNQNGLIYWSDLISFWNETLSSDCWLNGWTWYAAVLNCRLSVLLYCAILFLFHLDQIWCLLVGEAGKHHNSGCVVLVAQISACSQTSGVLFFPFSSCKLLIICRITIKRQKRNLCGGQSVNHPVQSTIHRFDGVSLSH